MRGTENSEGLMTCIASKEGSVLLAMYGIGGVVARALPGSDFLVRGAWQAATSGKPIPRNGDSLLIQTISHSSRALARLYAPSNLSWIRLTFCVLGYWPTVYHLDK